jgi:hypothetical protein
MARTWWVPGSPPLRRNAPRGLGPTVRRPVRPLPGVAPWPLMAKPTGGVGQGNRPTEARTARGSRAQNAEN